MAGEAPSLAAIRFSLPSDVFSGSGVDRTHAPASRAVWCVRDGRRLDLPQKSLEQKNRWELQ
jgi:hypothetical protein